MLREPSEASSSVLPLWSSASSSSSDKSARCGCDLPQVQSSKYELLWIKVGLCVNENGSFAKRGAILERAAKWARGL